MEQLFETAFTPKIGMAMSSNETIKQAVIAGLGIAFISAQRSPPNSTSRRLVTLDVVGLPSSSGNGFVLSTKGQRSLLPPARAMLTEFLSARGALIPAASPAAG